MSLTYEPASVPGDIYREFMEAVNRVDRTALRDLVQQHSFFFFFTLVTGPRRSLSLKLSDKKVYAPQIRARLGYHSTAILGFTAV